MLPTLAARVCSLASFSFLSGHCFRCLSSVSSCFYFFFVFSIFFFLRRCSWQLPANSWFSQYTFSTWFSPWLAPVCTVKSQVPFVMKLMSAELASSLSGCLTACLTGYLPFYLHLSLPALLCLSLAPPKIKPNLMCANSNCIFLMGHPLAWWKSELELKSASKKGVGAAVKAIISLIVAVHRLFDFWQSFAKVFNWPLAINDSAICTIVKASRENSF